MAISNKPESSLGLNQQPAFCPTYSRFEPRPFRVKLQIQIVSVVEQTQIQIVVCWLIPCHDVIYYTDLY